jgi:hypothetical protein
MTEMVQVPRRLIEELATYLTASDEPRVVVSGNGEWTRSMVRQLKREAGIYRGAIATGDLAAQRAGQLVSLAEISEVSGIPRQQIATDLAAFSKAARRLFTQKIWPFRALDSMQGMNYMMQPEMATWWLEE